MFDLCDELHVSYSTLRNVVNQLNAQFQSFGVSFPIERDVVHFRGNEQNKRRLISSVIYDETRDGPLDISILQNSFAPAMVNEVATILDESLSAHHYCINDFARIVFLLHLLVMAGRIRAGESLSDSSSIEIEDGSIGNLVEDVSCRLSDSFGIDINRRERAGMYLLFKSSTGTEMDDSIDYARKVVDETILDLTYDVARDVNDTYLIDLEDDRFLVPFALHLKTLIFRSRSGTHIANPMTSAIKRDCPIIYDVAVSISLMLKDCLALDLDDDEIAFIALHVGAEIERQKTAADKVSCVILCPSYHGVAEAMRDRILANFASQLNIVQIVSYEHQLAHLKFDLLISSVPVHSPGAYETVIMSPFSDNINTPAFNDAIFVITQRKKNAVLREHFGLFFHPELFVSNPEVSNKYDLINKLSSLMLKHGYVSNAFQGHVIERERAASTGFGAIAIPHSVSGDDVDRTSIAVVASRNGIEWDPESTVNVVFLIAVGDDARYVFNNVYEALFGLFSNDQLIQSAKEIDSFEGFKKLIEANADSCS